LPFERDEWTCLWIAKEEAIWPLKPDAWMEIDTIRKLDDADDSTLFKGRRWREGYEGQLLVDLAIAGVIEDLTGVHVEGASKPCRPGAILDVFIDSPGALNDQRGPGLSDREGFHDREEAVS